MLNINNRYIKDLSLYIQTFPGKKNKYKEILKIYSPIFRSPYFGTLETIDECAYKYGIIYFYLKVDIFCK